MTHDDDPERELLGRLTLEEKVSLLSGQDHWSLPALPAIGLDSIVMSDGPTGVKGDEEVAQGPTVPCGTALAATWTPELVEEVGSLLGETARIRGVHVLLAPATNMLRSPLGGRSFEYFSEDPLLAGTTTSAYVRGVQSEGVAATVKHFVCNDAESGRMHASVEVEDEPLREIYLAPFETAVRDAGAWAVMCSYNRLGGTFMSEHRLLDDLLRGEWGFDGIVVSDWGAVHDTVASARSGLDVEMPGPPAFRGERLVAAVRAGRIPEATIDEKVLRLFRLARRTGALGSSRPDRTPRRTPSDSAALLRRTAAESFVLLKNEDDLLPLARTAKIAVLGRVAELPPLQGGGSANVGPLSAPSPLAGMRALADPAAEILYEPGYGSSTVPRLDLTWLQAADGTAGFTVEVRDAADPGGQPIEVETRRTDRFVFRDIVAGRPLSDVVVRIRATLTPPVGGDYVFALNCAGTGTLRIAGEQVLELGPDHSLDWSYLFRSESRGHATVTLEAGRPVGFEVEYRMTPGPEGAIGLVTIRARPPEPEDALQRALVAASSADAAVVVVGLGEEHECEGYDRPSLALPPNQQELIAAVAAANPRTAVVVSAGGPVLVDWAEQVRAVLLVWYGGQELAPALGEVLFGRAEPGGRLPMTFPARPDDLPVVDPAPDDPANDQWHYREGLFLGYRHFDRYELEPAYCFGHGLGYTRFQYEELHVEPNGRGQFDVTVRVRNRGDRRGKEIVQVYIGSEDSTRPRRELRAYGRIDVDAGAMGELRLTLDERAFARWDRETRRFTPIPGRHEISVGSSSRDLRLAETVVLDADAAVAFAPVAER